MQHHTGPSGPVCAASILASPKMDPYMGKKCVSVLIGCAIVGEGFIPVTQETLAHGLPYSHVELTQPSTGQQAPNWPTAFNISSSTVLSSNTARIV